MQHITVVDPRLAAPRGEEFRAGALAAADKARLEALEAGEDWRLPMDHRIEENVELDGVEVASAAAPIPESNPG